MWGPLWASCHPTCSSQHSLTALPMPSCHTTPTSACRGTSRDRSSTDPGSGGFSHQGLFLFLRCSPVCKRWCHHSLLFSSPWPWMSSTPRAGHAEAPKQQLVSTDCLYFVSYSVDEGLGCLRWPVPRLCWWPAPAGGHHGPKDGSTSRFGLLVPAGLQVRGARAGDRRAVMRLAG